MTTASTCLRVRLPTATQWQAGASRSYAWLSRRKRLTTPYPARKKHPPVKFRFVNVVSADRPWLQSLWFQRATRALAEMDAVCAPVLGGLLADAFNPGVPFVAYAPLLVLSALLLPRLTVKLK